MVLVHRHAQSNFEWFGLHLRFASLSGEDSIVPNRR
jgi:hypothetical protein